MIVPELCPDDGLQPQLPEHAIAEALPADVKLTLKRPLVDVKLSEGTVCPENTSNVQAGVIHVDILNVS